MQKTLTLPKVDYNKTGRRINMVELELNLKSVKRMSRTIDLETITDYRVLSIAGGVWNGRHTDWLTGGQISDDVHRLYTNNKRVQRIVEIWDRWHLNDMNAGTRRQKEAIKEGREKWKQNGKGAWKFNYNEQCKYLESVGLLVDNGYEYGTAWLVEPLPGEIEEEIKQLFGVSSTDA